MIRDATGCVAWMFDRKGLLAIDKSRIDEERLMELALESGADDVRQQDDVYEVLCEPEVFSDVCQAIDQAGVETEAREITRIPKDTVDLDAETARKVLKLVEQLDEHDDVQSVSSNFNIPDEALAELESGEP